MKSTFFTMKKIVLLSVIVLLAVYPLAAAERFVSFQPEADAVCLTELGGQLQYDAGDHKGVLLAVENLRKDLMRTTGRTDLPIVVGTLGRSKLIDRLAKKNSHLRQLRGKREMFVITMMKNQLVVAGSDKRGTIYGIYELCEQLGVSPWYDWADVPVEQHARVYIKNGVYTDGEPAVRYRGIFLNDEAPCLSGWVGENFGGVYNHAFYARVFELVLRLKGNFMWPAMWNSAFYADDPLNMQTADDMGVMMGTSHHEPMARAHKEWTRVRTRGPWNYDTNKAELDEFWQSGVERMKHTEDVVTIGMRGNGDEPMGKNADVALLERIVNNQRQQIEAATGRPACETPQVWALYKEVQEYYEKGMKVPDDVILLLCDDNWGNVRILPELDGNQATGAFAKRHPGGYGMYYHVDYVGGPRNSKFLNVSQIQRMWEQLQLTYEYGVDQLWILNVGDLKPMEFPIDFWFRMAWNPKQFQANNLQEYTEAFCRQQFGGNETQEAARLLNLQCKYAHRRTPEQLDATTYNFESGEWRQRLDEYLQLEHDAAQLRQKLPTRYHDTFDELIGLPVRLMANLYQMYYAVAAGDSNQVAACFNRDAELCGEYNHRVANGKWNHMMDEVHIGYTSWNGPRANRMPSMTLPPVRQQQPANVLVAFNAPTEKTDGAYAKWQEIPDFGVYESAFALFPYTACTEGASLAYDFKLDAAVASPQAVVVLAPTFPFNSGRGQRLSVSLDGKDVSVVNINEASRYVIHGYHDQNYEWEKTRMNRQTVELPALSASSHRLVLSPLDPGVVIERVEIVETLRK